MLEASPRASRDEIRSEGIAALPDLSVCELVRPAEAAAGQR
jgi:hypothetical protein